MPLCSEINIHSHSVSAWMIILVHLFSSLGLLVYRANHLLISESIYNDHWARVLPIKDTSRAHIVQATSSCISDEDLKMVKSVLTQKSIGHSSGDDNDDDEQEPKKKNSIVNYLDKLRISLAFFFFSSCSSSSLLSPLLWPTLFCFNTLLTIFRSSSLMQLLVACTMWALDVSLIGRTRAQWPL